jgi:hypothetical protein
MAMGLNKANDAKTLTKYGGLGKDKAEGMEWQKIGATRASSG